MKKVIEILVLKQILIYSDLSTESSKMIYAFLQKGDVQMQRMLYAMHRQPKPVSQPAPRASFKDSQDQGPFIRLTHAKLHVHFYRIET